MVVRYVPEIGVTPAMRALVLFIQLKPTTICSKIKEYGENRVYLLQQIFFVISWIKER